MTGKKGRFLGSGIPIHLVISKPDDFYELAMSSFSWSVV